MPIDWRARWLFVRSLRFPIWEPLAVLGPFAVMLWSLWRDEAPPASQPPLLISLLERIPWYVSALVALFLALAFVFEASYRKVGEVQREGERERDALRAELAEIRLIPPLVALTARSDAEGRFRRLRVENPNAVPVRQVSVSVVSYVDADGTDLTISGPVRNHRFPWQTQARDKSSKFADIRAYGHEFADLLLLQPLPEGGLMGGLFWHLDIGPDVTVQRFSPSPPGIYEMVVEITAIDPPVPVARFALHITLAASMDFQMLTEPL